MRTQGNAGVVPVHDRPDPLADPPVAAAPADCVPSHETLFIPNVTTDVGLSPPYNSLFTFFGQFFDHGVDQTVKSGAPCSSRCKADDPLRHAGPDGKAGDGRRGRPASQRFMVLTRAQNQPGPDGVLGDDPATPRPTRAPTTSRTPTNTDSPWVDQSQTYTSHSSHQVFLREYVLNGANRPVDTGKLLGGLPGNGASGMATWASVKAQAASKLGLQLVDADVTNIPMLAADPYGNFIPGPARAAAVRDRRPRPGRGQPRRPRRRCPADVRHFDTPFLTDIAHNADPSPVGHRPQPGHAAGRADARTTTTWRRPTSRTSRAGTYDDEMLDAHFCAGDGRVNENIALTAVHQIFHSEHDRLVDDIKHVLDRRHVAPTGVAALAAVEARRRAPTAGTASACSRPRASSPRWSTSTSCSRSSPARSSRRSGRSTSTSRTSTRRSRPSSPTPSTGSGTRCSTTTVARRNEDGSRQRRSPLLDAFLNPPEYFNGGAAGRRSRPSRRPGASSWAPPTRPATSSTSS